MTPLLDTRKRWGHPAPIVVFEDRHVAGGRPWTKHEDARVREVMQPVHGRAQALAEELNRSVKAVRKRAQRLMGMPPKGAKR